MGHQGAAGSYFGSSGDSRILSNRMVPEGVWMKRGWRSQDAMRIISYNKRASPPSGKSCGIFARGPNAGRFDRKRDKG